MSYILPVWLQKRPIAKRPTIPYYKCFLRHVYMLTRLYPISLDTYSISSPSSKQRHSTSNMNSADRFLGWSGLLHLWSLFTGISAVWPCLFSGPAFRRSHKRQRVDWLGYPNCWIDACTDPTVHILSAPFFLFFCIHSAVSLFSESNFLSASPSPSFPKGYLSVGIYTTDFKQCAVWHVKLCC